MEHYLRRDRLSAVLDTLGAWALIYALSLLWFVYLWGLSVPSMLAGAALGTLLLTARAKWRQRTVIRREKALRCRLGGEMMLEDMLLSGAREAHFRAALLLGERWLLTMQEAREDGVLCRQGEETLLVQCIRMMPDGELSAGDIIGVQRAVRQAKADRGVLCVLGRVSPKMAARAEEAPVPLRIVRRETLLAIAGQLSPATDAQLIALGERRRRRMGRAGLLRLVFRQDKAPRYALYGVMMLILYLLSSARLYAVLGMVCLTMAVCSRSMRQAEAGL